MRQSRWQVLTAQVATLLAVFCAVTTEIGWNKLEYWLSAEGEVEGTGVPGSASQPRLVESVSPGSGATLEMLIEGQSDTSAPDLHQQYTTESTLAYALCLLALLVKRIDFVLCSTATKSF